MGIGEKEKAEIKTKLAEDEGISLADLTEIKNIVETRINDFGKIPGKQYRLM